MHYFNGCQNNKIPKSNYNKTNLFLNTKHIHQKYANFPSVIGFKLENVNINKCKKFDRFSLQPE